MKLGVTAVVEPESLAKLSDPDKDELLTAVKRPDEVLPSILAELEGKSDYQVLMVQGPPEEAKRLASAYPGFDIVMSKSAPTTPNKIRRCSTTARRCWSTSAVAASTSGAIGFFDSDARMRYYRVTLNHNYNGPAPAMKKVIEDEYRGTLKDMGTVENFPRHDYVNGAPGATFVGGRVVQDLPPQHLRQKWLPPSTPRRSRPSSTTPSRTRCSTRSASPATRRASNTRRAGSSEAATPNLKGNQCENCHGPASKHVADPDDAAFRALALTAEQVDKNRTLHPLPRRGQLAPIRLRHLLRQDRPQGTRHLHRPEGPREDRRGEGGKAMTQTQTAASPTRRERMAASYREDHQNPINHVLHVGVGWPIAAIAVIVAPFRPLLGLELFALAYLVMWTGHFVFERTCPPSSGTRRPRSSWPGR